MLEHKAKLYSKKLMKKFRLAKTVSELSTHNHKIGCAIYRGNRLISVGFNQIKSHPVLANEDRFYSLHAEMMAILKAKRDLVGCSIYVFRQLKNGCYGMAKPCSNCMGTIIESGITTIYYTTNENSIEQINL